ncbi:hypothetical protein EBB07_27935 [Paenibacillaceae bacterium]|nr:hypothetical protein EBB07_27935 [Paenibacillaceae bacterium]
MTAAGARRTGKPLTAAGARRTGMALTAARARRTGKALTAAGARPTGKALTGSKGASGGRTDELLTRALHCCNNAGFSHIFHRIDVECCKSTGFFPINFIIQDFFKKNPAQKHQYPVKTNFNVSNPA